MLGTMSKCKGSKLIFELRLAYCLVQNFTLLNWKYTKSDNNVIINFHYDNYNQEECEGNIVFKVSKDNEAFQVIKLHVYKDWISRTHCGQRRTPRRYRRFRKPVPKCIPSCYTIFGDDNDNVEERNDVKIIIDYSC